MDKQQLSIFTARNEGQEVAHAISRGIQSPSRNSASAKAEKIVRC